MFKHVKILLIMALVFALMCLVAFSSLGAGIQSEDFNQMSTGAYTGTIRGTDANATISVEKHTHLQNDHYLLINTEVTTYGYGMSIDKGDAKITVSFDYMQESSAIKSTAIALYTGAYVFPPAVSMSMSKGGTIAGFDGSANNDRQGKFPVGKWVKVTITIDPTQKNFRFYVDGVCLENRDFGFRNAEASSIDTMALMGGVFRVDNILVEAGITTALQSKLNEVKEEPVKFSAILPEITTKDLDTKSKYSDVYLSSRLYYTENLDVHPRTLEALKSFMATGNKWSYLFTKEEIKALTNLGISHQSTINANLGGESVFAQYIDGTFVQAPWMTWGTKTACLANPGYLELQKNQIRQDIDAGATSIQFDDWSSSYHVVTWGGCFCPYCEAGFKAYLKNVYTPAQLSELGVANIEVFTYKAYLKEKLGVATAEEYKAKLSQSKLYKARLDYGTQVARDFMQKTKEFADFYAKRPMMLTQNVTEFGNKFNDFIRTFAFDLADGGLGEIKEKESLSPASILAGGYIAKSQNKAYLYCPSPSYSDMKTTLQAIALGYATGQHMLVPWDVWLQSNNERYYGSVAEFGFIYHFVRQYPELFDDYEQPAKTALLFDLDVVDATKVKSAIYDVFRKNIPIKVLIHKDKNPTFKVSKEALQNVNTIVAYSPLEGLSDGEKALISSSGATIIEPSAQNTIASTHTVLGDNANILSLLRENTKNPNAPKLMHFINTSASPQKDVTVALSAQLIQSENANAIFYTPKNNPMMLPITDGKFTLPSLDMWGIVKIVPKNAASNDNYAFKNGFSGITLGTRPSPSDKAVQIDDAFSITSSGYGLNVGTVGDAKGSQDNVSFIYKNATNAVCRSYEVTATITENSGLAGVMIRKNPSSNSEFVALSLQKDGKLSIAKREKPDEVVVFSELKSVNLPITLKLFYLAGKISAFQSDDGINFTAIGEVSMNLPQALAGAFGSGGTVKFSSIAAENTNVDAVVLMIDQPIAKNGIVYSKIDASNLDVCPIVVDDRTLVPLRFIAQSFGASVAFDERQNKVSVSLSGKEISLIIGENTMKVGDENVKLDVAANTYYDRTFLPLRAMAEALGKKVFWDDRGLIVISDKEVVSNKDESIIVDLINNIKNYSYFAKNQS